MGNWNSLRQHYFLYLETQSEVRGLGNEKDWNVPKYLDRTDGAGDDGVQMESMLVALWFRPAPQIQRYIQ